MLHLSAEMLAGSLGKNQSTYHAWVQRLQAQGYLHARPHYTTVTARDGQRVTVVNGTLYAIRVEPGHQAHLSYEDLTRSYRDLDADREAGRTAWKVMQQAAQLD
ncbi:hypothetical protein [Deinococcus koreensis]|uniref:Uncharacterized protein n=1 Tax=Deinococcus koreensis TaxID=2054903 RepID=A0A2K3US15_9DEIO|nr:hypothetical protein [Deinococcus koreensis]PNY79342.1 hypothetical protein CVO96_19650 [Deinococcus koreensis]